MKNVLTVVGLSACCWLAGCGQTEEHTAGIEGTGDKVDTVVASGTVTGFGSIYVNGVHFNTDAATFTLEGEAIDESDLAVGMVVSVEGSIANDGENGTATAVHAEHVLEGRIDSVATIASGRKALGILGQTVYVNEDVAIDGVSFDELAEGLELRISGFIADDGKVTATHCDRATDLLASATLEGRVTALDAANDQFAINGQWVSTASADFKGGDLASLAIGTRVKVRGTLSGDENMLIANTVELLTRDHGRSAIRALEGVIEISGSVYSVDGMTLDIANATIENGSADDLRSGTQVMVFGEVQAGIFVVDRLLIKSLNTTRLRGEISAIDETARTLTVLDITVAINAFTQFTDSSMQMQRYFHFGDLRLGEDVEIYAVQVNGKWQATRVMRRDRDEQRPNVLRGLAIIDMESTVFYLDDITVDGGELSEQTWQMLRSLAGPAIVEVEGYFTAFREFTALSVRVHVLPECDPHIFFECNNDERTDREMPFDPRQSPERDINSPERDINSPEHDIEIPERDFK